MGEKSAIKLSGRERDVMEILWASETPMIASDIANTEQKLSINTVNVVLKGLLKKGIIEVADIVYSGTVLTRSYRPIVSASDYALGFVHNLGALKRRSVVSDLVANLVNQDDTDAETINELENILEARRKKMEK